jgi:hypothetical protein
MSILYQQALKVVKWERNTIHASFLSHWFIEFYKGEPWNEYLMCPRCKDADDYGPAHTYGVEEVVKKSLKICPVCGEKLDFFWSEDRVKRYLFSKKDSDGNVIFYKDEIAAWWRGYSIKSDVFYIDVVALLPKFRKEPGFRVFLNEFKKFLERKRKEGYREFVTRTHREAKNTRFLLRELGFKENEPSDDPERTYWRLNYEDRD